PEYCAGCQRDDDEHHEERAANGKEDSPAHGSVRSLHRRNGWVNAYRDSITTVDRPSMRRVSSSTRASAPGGTMSRGDGRAVSIAPYHASLPWGTGARVKSTGVSEAFSMIKMSLSSLSASISDLLPS